MSQLRLADVAITSSRPHLRIRKDVAKGRRARVVPLWWDAGTLADLQAWKAERQDQGARPGDLFVCSVRARALGQQLNRHVLRRRFQKACRSLGWERAERLTTHDGRHTFVSHALAGGRTLAEVRDAAGHANVSVTSIYLHMAVDDNGELGNLFRL